VSIASKRDRKYEEQYENQKRLRYSAKGDIGQELRQGVRDDKGQTVSRSGISNETSVLPSRTWKYSTSVLEKLSKVSGGMYSFDAMCDVLDLFRGNYDKAADYLLTRSFKDGKKHESLFNEGQAESFVKHGRITPEPYDRDVSRDQMSRSSRVARPTIQPIRSIMEDQNRNTGSHVGQKYATRYEHYRRLKSGGNRLITRISTCSPDTNRWTCHDLLQDVIVRIKPMRDIISEIEWRQYLEAYHTASRNCLKLHDYYRDDAVIMIHARHRPFPEGKIIAVVVYYIYSNINLGKSGDGVDVAGTICILFNLRGLERDTITYCTSNEKLSMQTTIQFSVSSKSNYVCFDSAITQSSIRVPKMVRPSHIIFNLGMRSKSYVDINTSTALADVAQVAMSGQDRHKRNWIRFSFNSSEEIGYKALAFLDRYGGQKVSDPSRLNKP